MNICRFTKETTEVRVGLLAESDSVIDLTDAGITRMESLLEAEDPVARCRELLGAGPPEVPLARVNLCAPVEAQEVWAAGVTYLRSKKARMDESDFSASAYDRVYEAVRPELFFKSLPEKVVPPGRPVGIRRDARWSVPEPELALVFNSRGRVVGYTIGNDMSSRDIEGENLLYLPQAKIYEGSCALGPWITLGIPEATAREWEIGIRIQRQGRDAFAGATSAGLIRRSFDDLGEFLFRSQRFPHGAVLLTGTGIVPPDSFTLEAGDEVVIEISGIGVLRNLVARV